MKNINYKKGYAILFTLVIVSIILAIATGMSSSVYKEQILSSTSSSSQAAFYQADTAAECGIYAAQKVNLSALVGSIFTCGRDIAGNPIFLNVSSPTTNEYKLNPPLLLTSSPCFTLDIMETPATTTTPASADIFARGYNICDAKNPHQVERGLELKY